MSVAIGCATRDRTVAFASTFAAFFARAYDHIRMAAISQSNVNLVGSHCGVSIGKASWCFYLDLIHSQVFSFIWNIEWFIFNFVQVRMALHRWHWRISQCSALFQHAQCFTPVMEYLLRELWNLQPIQGCGLWFPLDGLIQVQSLFWHQLICCFLVQC